MKQGNKVSLAPLRTHDAVTEGIPAEVALYKRARVKNQMDVN